MNRQMKNLGLGHKVAMVMVLGLTNSAFAAVSVSEAVNLALTVAEQEVTPQGLMGSMHYLKSVGGLRCMRYQSVTPNPTSSFYCALDFENRNDEAIYKALNVKEVNITPIGVVGSGTWFKSAGRFSCSKFQGVYPNAVASYSCNLN